VPPEITYLILVGWSGGIASMRGGGLAVVRSCDVIGVGIRMTEEMSVNHGKSPLTFFKSVDLLKFAIRYHWASLTD